MDIHPTRYNAAAFTLTELMVGLGVAGLLGAAVAGFMFQFSRNSSAIVSFAKVTSADRHSIEVIGRDFREAESLVSLNSSNMSLKVRGETIQLLFDQPRRALVRKASGQNKTLLENCEGLSFSFFERTGASTNFENFLVSTSANCRAVKLSWVSVVRTDKNDRWTVTNSARFLNRRGFSN